MDKLTRAFYTGVGVYVGAIVAGVLIRDWWHERARAADVAALTRWFNRASAEPRRRVTRAEVRSIMADAESALASAREAKHDGA